MTCANCGAELRPGALFCGDCGARVSPTTALTIEYTPVRKHPPVPQQPLIWSSDSGPIPTPDLTPAPTPITIDDLEATILAPRRRPWILTGPDGVEHPIRVPTVIGRAPQRPVDRHDAEVLPLADRTKSLSKTHALVELDGDAFMITDLDSTNGIAVVDESGNETMLPAHVPVSVAAGTRFELGDYILVIDRR